MNNNGLDDNIDLYDNLKLVSFSCDVIWKQKDK